MKYTGEFISQKGHRVAVTIVTNADTTTTIEIGEEAAGVFFTTDPVTITGEINDTFDVMLTHSASISLLTREHQPELFCKSPLDAAVSIRMDGKLVFAGYVEPMAYNQPYNEREDKLTLSCIDVLSALQYVYYQDIGHGGTYYRQAKREAGQRYFMALLYNTLQEATYALITDTEKLHIWYDGSKALDSDEDTDPYKVFQDLSVNDLLFLGDEMDEVWTTQDIISEMLRYLNLHIIQVGLDFYIFDWRSLRDRNAVKWMRLWQITESGQPSSTETLTPPVVTLTNSIAADTDAEISVGEVFNRLELKANVSSMDAVIESPLDEDLLTNAFSSKQLYMEEIASDGEGSTAYENFKAMILGKTATWEWAFRRKWFVQVKKNSQWTFGGGGVKDIYGKYAKTNRNQQDFLNALRDKMGAGIVAVGKVENKMSEDDNSLVSSVSMENCLFITANGNGVDTEAGYAPNADDIKKVIPVATYTGNTSGGVFSPPDDLSNNYIVISGKMILNPLMERTDSITALYKAFSGQTVKAEDCDDLVHYLKYQNTAAMGTPYWHCTVDIQADGNQHENRYYAQELYTAETPRSEAATDRSRKFPLCPFTEEVRKEDRFKFKYTYSELGYEEKDKISKVPVLACMLVIGNKCAVEEFVEGTEGSAQTEGAQSTIVWKTYKTLDECADEDEYYAQSFTIGFNPKISDVLIGTEYSIQNTIDYTMGIDAEGTHIKIRREDHVSGAVQFKILGLVNLTWEDIVRKHPTFFRHTKWSSTSIPVMAHVSSVILKEFSMKVYSDNGLEDTGEDNDYVYYSDTDENYYNKKDDLEFKITSALTTDEALEMGVTNTVAYSTPQDNRTGDAIITIYDARQGVTAKPEQLYVDAYYEEYHQPRMELTQKVLLSDELGVEATDLWRTLFYHPAPDKTFYPEAVSFNLMQAYAELQLKEL